MSTHRYKTTYAEMGNYGDTNIEELYCEHQNASDVTTVFDAKGNVIFSFTESFAPPRDMGEAIDLLLRPHETFNTLREGVEFIRSFPWEKP